MTEREKMLNNLLYSGMDEEIRGLQMKAKGLVYDYNLTRPEEGEKRQEILKELFGSTKGITFIEPSFHCDFGSNIFFEGLAIVNYNCVMLDTSKITIGENAFIGPGTCLACAGHPLVPEERNQGYIVSKPITLEKNVWLGANCTVVGGVTIGEGSVIGSGSVVTKDIPAGVVAVGNPCRVMRKVTDADRVL